MSCDKDCKLIVLNYGKNKGSQCLEELLTQNNIGYTKVVKVRHLSYGFIVFSSKEARDKSLPLVQNLKMKNVLLEVKNAIPRKSVKPNVNADEDSVEQADKDGIGAANAIEAVTPWAHIAYPDQLSKKQADVKKVLITLARRTRKEFCNKRKIVQSEQRRVRMKTDAGKKQESTEESVISQVPLPDWLKTHGLFHIIRGGKLQSWDFSQSSKENWNLVGALESATAIVSFGADLIASVKDKGIFTVTKSDEGIDLRSLCAGPKNMDISSLASFRGYLLCCTSDGSIYAINEFGTAASGAWKNVGKIENAKLITVSTGHLIVYSTSKNWFRAQICFDSEFQLQFESYDVKVDVSVIGLTSYDAHLICLTPESIMHIDGDGNHAKTTQFTNTDSKAPCVGFTIHKGMCCPLDPIEASPVTEGYRNKCEFSIGRDESGKPCVGFRLGLFKNGSVIVAHPQDCINVSDTMKSVCKAVQNLIEKSKYPVYDVVSHSGVWRLLTVRHSTRTNQLMIVLQLDTASIEETQRIELQKTITTSLTKALDITSLYIQSYSGHSTPNDDTPLEQLYGQPTIEEILFDMRFTISPQAFFQVNTDAAERLYAKVRKFVRDGKKDFLYDVCCGTGTIGICCANDVQKVVGIEMCKTATVNATDNAKCNKIENISFVNQKAEEISDLLQANSFTDVTVVVDPPRNGLHHKVLKALRACLQVRRIIYVSCNPLKSLVQDSTFLCGPNSKTVKGDAFRPTHAAAFDMFPHTPHCEMVLVLER